MFFFFFFPHCFFTDLSIRDAGERDLILETTPALAEQMWCQAASKAAAFHEENKHVWKERKGTWMHLPGMSGSPDVLTHFKLTYIAKHLCVSIGLYVYAKRTVWFWGFFLVLQLHQAIPHQCPLAAPVPCLPAMEFICWDVV